MTAAGDTTTPTQRVAIVARLAERAAMRYTPAGISALDLVLAHESEQIEAGHPRLVRLQLKAVALGEVAERLAAQALGTTLDCAGFLAPGRRGTGVVFHIQDFKPI